MNPNGLTMIVVKKEKTVFWEKMMTSERSDRPMPAIEMIVDLSIFFPISLIIHEFLIN